MLYVKTGPLRTSLRTSMTTRRRTDTRYLSNARCS